MKSHKKRVAALGFVAALAALAGAPAAGASNHITARASESAHSEHSEGVGRTRVYRAKMNSLNGSGATGVAKLRLQGDQLDIRIDARGLLPNSVHAQHIHGVGNSECPPPSAAGPDGILTTADGLPFYGPIAVSLTNSGDTSPAAGLAIPIMPVADANGEIHYRRTITLPADVAADLGSFQIVQHGIDVNDNGVYDFGAGPSELDPALPQEATAPADCGTIDPIGHHHHS